MKNPHWFDGRVQDVSHAITEGYVVRPKQDLDEDGFFLVLPNTETGLLVGRVRIPEDGQFFEKKIAEAVFERNAHVLREFFHVHPAEKFTSIVFGEVTEDYPASFHR